MDDTKVLLEKWIGEIQTHKSPEWDKLPDIDLYMDQVILMMEKQLDVFMRDASDRLITPSMVNNYVKHGLIAPPVNKKYSRSHIAYLMAVCILKEVLPIPDITDLMRNQEEKTDIAGLFNLYCEMQDEALHAVADDLADEIADVSEEDLENRLNMIALNLTVNANAHKLAAEKIIHLMKMKSKPKEPSPKEKARKERTPKEPKPKDIASK
jgi:DNA-binding transcriptional MerR regulator